MSWSGSGKPDSDLEGMELLFHQKGGSASFDAKMALSLNGVYPSCMNSITGSTCWAKCLNILHDNMMVANTSLGNEACFWLKKFLTFDEKFCEGGEVSDTNCTGHLVAMS
jgi:hypothetical protein